MAQKIQNIDTEITKEQIEIQWSEVFSTRNKLLEISDWTQLSDVFLSAESKKQWSIWRHKLRKVNRKNFSNLQEAKDVLELLKHEIPKTSTFDESEFNDKIVNTEITNNKIVEKIITKEQPIIIKEIIEESRFKDLMISIMEKDAHTFKSYLLSFIKTEHPIVITDDDNIEYAKNKAKLFAKEKQIIRLNEKLANLPDQRILNQRAEEAIEFLSIKSPDLENYPMIKLHSENEKMTPQESATNFLRQKKWFNTILLDADKFLYYTNKQIDESENNDQIRSIVQSIMYGY